MGHGGRDEGLAAAAVAPEETGLWIEEEEPVAAGEVLHVIIRTLEAVADMPQLQVEKSVQAAGDTAALPCRRR